MGAAPAIGVVGDTTDGDEHFEVAPGSAAGQVW